MEYRLPVQLNRDDVHAVEVATATFETPGSFALELSNHGQPVHVHLQLDDALSRVASVAANNHYVDSGSVRTVTVEVVADRRPVEGKLKIVTAYGRETAYVDVRVVEGEVEEAPVDVAPTPEPRAPDTTPAAVLLTRENAPVVGLAVLALAIAVGVLTRARGVAVLLGAAAVLAGIATAFYVLAS